MIVKSIIDTDYVNYKDPSMFISTARCNWKCCVEANIPIETCQNNLIASMLDIEISADEILRRYLSNPLSKAIVFGGLEPFLQFEDVFQVIKQFRECGVFDPIIIYTGYTEDEVENKVAQLELYNPIIIKYGRFIPNDEAHFDEALGVTLASRNQYSKPLYLIGKNDSNSGVIDPTHTIYLSFHNSSKIPQKGGHL